MRPVSSDEMRRLERETSERYGIPSRQLMENAGRAVAELIAGETRPCPLLVFAGKGNNGGDGFVAVRYLAQRGFKPAVIALEPPERMTPESRFNYDLLKSLPVEICLVREDAPVVVAEKFFKETPVIDAILGTGIRGQVSGYYQDIIRAMNRSGCPVYSVDIPSGLNSDTGEISGSAVKASKTLALGLPKKGFYLANGPDCVGDVRVLDIGIPPRLLEPYLH